MDVALAVDSREMQTGIRASSTHPKQAASRFSEATYTVNVTDPTPEPSDEDPFGEPQRFSHAKATWE